MSDVEDERLWNDFVAAKERAMQTQTLRDGLAAREAWRRFMRIYAPAPSEQAAQPSTRRIQ